MNKPHLVGPVRQMLARAIALCCFAALSTMAFAQATVGPLVDAATAVTRLQPHYNQMATAFNSLDEKAAGYEYEHARLEFTLAIYEDAQLGIDPGTSINKRLASSYTYDPTRTLTDREMLGQSAGNGQPAPAKQLDPIVNELVQLLL